MRSNGRHPRRGSIAVLIVDDHRSFGQALETTLRLEDDIVARSVSNGREAELAIAEQRFDVVLMDVAMPGADGVEVAHRLLALEPRLAVILLSAHTDDALRVRALRSGVSGVLSKAEPIEQVIDAIHRCHAGERPIQDAEALRHTDPRRRRIQHATEGQRADRLSPREREILQLMVDGLETADISMKLGISPHTLRTHVQNILTKLGVHSKTQAVLLAVRQGTVSARI